MAIMHHPAGGRAAARQIAGRLQPKRRELDLSIRCVAYLADVDRSTVRAVEAGRASTASVMKVAGALHAYEAFVSSTDVFDPAAFLASMPTLFSSVPGELEAVQ
jgi:hypothetical protein